MKTKLKGVSYAKWGYIFSIPFIVIFLIFSLYPTIYTTILGFTDCVGLNNTTWKFLDDPFKNFDTILHNKSFITSLKNTVLIWVLNFTPQITMALLLSAIFTSHRNEIKGKGFFKVVFYMPNIITAASVAILFNALFAYPVGPINDLLVSTGLRDEGYNFLVYKTPSQLIIAFIQFLTWYGNTMIVLISGILGISPDIYEAAEIDGSNGWQTFWKITVPNLKTVLLYTLITSLVGGLNMYDIPKLFNQGGPDNSTLTTSVFIYNQAFSGKYLYNRAAAASMILFVIIAALSAVLFWIMRDKDEARIEKEKKMALREAKKKEAMNKWR
ncbi:MAG: sugar ABC transporter permease [Clostridia bacterium]|nr:sugar ABC transporter permease [Clostridia bacterium]